MIVRGQDAAAKPLTADLFDPDPHASRRSAFTAVRAVAPSSQSVPLPRSRQLWYAVVFSELSLPLQRLGTRALRFTSLVSLEMPNALLLEIRGSVRLFGSIAVLHAALDAQWQGMSLRATTAAAPTALAALWFARAGKRICIEDPAQLAAALADLPVGCTAWNAAWLQTLRSLGVTRMAEVMRLPRAGVARRLSPAAVLDLDIALARQPAPRRAFLPRRRFRETCDFEMEIETAVGLHRAIEPVIERCARFLRDRQAGVQTLELRLKHRTLPATRLRLGLASVTSEHRRLADVLREKLSRLELAAPVRGVQLLTGSLQPLSADSLDAFAGMRGSGRDVRTGDTAPQLVERLRARLGDESVYGVRPIAQHRPEAACRRVHELHPAAVSRVIGETVPGMRRPVWLLDAPVLLSSDLAHLLKQGVILEQGPERIESGWWEGHDVTRDYYVVRQMRGARWWVFQERQSRSWYLHGLFA